MSSQVHLFKQHLIKTINGAPPLFSPALFLITYAYLFRQLSNHDWGPASVLSICLASLFVFVFFIARLKPAKTQSAHTLWLEMVLLIFTLTLILSHHGSKYLPYLSTSPTVDIGSTTQQAAKVFFLDHQNPYRNKDISRLGDNQEFWGYKKGPAMFLGYWPASIFPNSGFKTSSLLFLLISIFTLTILVTNKKKTALQNITAVLFTITVLLIPERFWYELFAIGVNDMLPILLLLISFIFIKNNRWLPAGIMIGLSFSAKFVPAALLILLLMRKQSPLRILPGLLLGLSPILIFLIWDHHTLINNVFLFHATKNYDITSLYSITPKNLHGLFPVIQLFAIGSAVLINFHKKIKYETLIIQFTLLFLVIEITYRQIHTNHMIIFAPLFSLIYCWYRYRLTNIPKNILRRI